MPTQEHTRQLETLAENISMALFIMDERRHCTFMNSAAERLTGYTLAEVRGRMLHDVLHHTRPDGRPYPVEECPIGHAVAADARGEGEEVFVHRDGHFYPVAFTASPIREGERTVGTVIEVRAIAAERSAEEERQRLLEALETERARLANVFQNAASYIAVLRGPDHVFELANPLYRRLTGERPLLGRAARDALPELVAQGYIGLLDEVRRTGVPYTATEAPVSYRNAPDEPPSLHFINFVYQPLAGPGGEVSGILAHGVDVTEQVVARREVERARDLSARLQRLTARLNEAVGRAHIADVILEGGLAAVGADAGSLALVHPGPDGRSARFEIVRTRGYTDEVTAKYREFPLEPGRPLSEAVLRRETVLVGSPEEWRREFPEASEDLTRMGYGAFAAAPASVGERTLAALSFSFRQPQRFDDGTRTFLATLAEQCALALERARLHEVELQHAERHAALLETIQDAFVALDRELRYTYVNPRAELILRHRADELLGRRLEEVFPIASGTPVYNAILRTLVTGEGTQVEAFSPVICRWAEARIYPAPDGVSLVFQDVTERRRTQDADALLAEASRLLSASLDYETTLRAVADAAVPRLGDWCAVDVVDDPSLREWPPRIHRLAVVHRDPEKLALGQELAARYPVDWAAEGGFADVLRTGQPFFVPHVTDAMLVAVARGEEHLALLRALRFSSVMVVPLSARDLTLGALTLCMTESERRYDERDLALAQDLARRAAVAIDNARLFRDAERARADAESANRSKSEFLATMSHELRTPLNAIDGYAELMEIGVHGPVTPAQAGALARIRRSQKHLLGLINEVLNYARLETGAVRYDVRVVDVAGAVTAVEPLILPQVNARSLTLETERGARALAAYADEEKLRQILVNLLSNAVKFTDPGGRIRVEVRGAEGVVEVAVRDTGIGIAPDKLEAVFEPFVQVGRALNNPTEGTGLGLAISRDLARAMGGDLTVRSTPGVGSTFTLTLPAAEA